MALLIKNIKSLINTENKPVKWVAGSDMQKLNTIENAYLLIEKDIIVDFGKMSNLKINDFNGKTIDATGKMVFPSFCDSHTHLVYAGSREIEYGDKIRGLSYEEIAKRGGGILNSAKLLHNTSEESLYQQSLQRINEIIGFGTGAVEIKSGYGLNLEDELKMLRVIKRLKETTPVTIRSTFLGAHAVPAEYKGKQGEYVDLIINEMIPVIASEDLADYIDVFCDKGFFTVQETERMLMAGIKYGMRPKIHANELDFSGGIQVGVKYEALSVDHLEFTGDEEIQSLKNSETMPTLLPGAAFFLGMIDPPVRKMISAGLPVALASDYNPGSSPSGNMKFIMSLGTIKLRMLPEEVIHATTINGAYAMGISDTHGSIAKGKIANVFITKEIPTYDYMPYAYTSNLIEKVILNGKVIM
ncbi:MAG: imidazolonepropionase [Bacteroidetes bacterium GWC2_33_15]|nr:MAG: imidazolonepropionase [Bacteroidetes bacterium GWA2_33_15]OFX52131.1 MAG: imidazolonepropionase [Bacteroidetes bacterium GWC2_33_15]OFX64285.1 MAG: imidazolonepropionase [Bacteroidetes bacterium GWB2_32_14]OFX67690.1 MAG: imidazolonepropionase [Bacteroidetes bacterium GWD2_33_33]HAN19298.1 imidazolonepropionase [Bacteroidales bacterium]